MVIYLEGILILSSMIHLNFQKLSSRLLGLKEGLCEKIVSTIAVDIFMLLYCYYPSLDWFKFLALGVIVYLSFRKERIKAGFIYFLLNVFLGGLVMILEPYLKNFTIPIVFFTFFIIFGFELYIRRFQKQKTFIYPISINGIDMKGFLDSGNQVIIDGLPVIFLKRQVKAQKVKTVFLEGVIGKEEITLYKINSFILFVDNIEKEIECYIAYGNIQYDCLLNIHVLDWR